MRSESMSRRAFMQTTAATGAAALTMPSLGSLAGGGTTLRVLSIGVVGTIGGHDRKTINSHPRAEIVGLCDVDAAGKVFSGAS